MLKVLIVEDDQLVRLFLKKLLTKRFNFTVLQANNGIEGLSLIHEHSPDLILLDISMPLMDGLEMLHALREDPDNRGIPVAVLTAFSDKDLVGKLLELGISDFILKPLDLDNTYERLNKIISENRILQKKQQNVQSEGKTGETDERRKLLIIDKDQKTRSLFNSLFSGKFDVIEGVNGADCLKYVLEYKPKYVFLTENLEVISERLLAEKLRALDSNKDLQIYLLTNNLANLSAWQKTYDGIIKKSSNPETLEKEFKRVVLGSSTAFTGIKELLNSTFRKEIFSALRQSFGVIAQTDITEIAKPSKFIEYEISNKIILRDKEKETNLSIILLTSKPAMKAIVKKAVGINDPAEEMLRKTFEDIHNVTADRIKIALRKYDYSFIQLKIDERRKKIIPPKNAWNLSMTIATSDKNVFTIGILAE